MTALLTSSMCLKELLMILNSELGSDGNPVRRTKKIGAPNLSFTVKYDPMQCIDDFGEHAKPVVKTIAAYIRRRRLEVGAADCLPGRPALRDAYQWIGLTVEPRDRAGELEVWMNVERSRQIGCLPWVQ